MGQGHVNAKQIFEDFPFLNQHFQVAFWNKQLENEQGKVLSVSTLHNALDDKTRGEGMGDKLSCEKQRVDNYGHDNEKTGP